jgi:hypothetical protein
MEAFFTKLGYVTFYELVAVILIGIDWYIIEKHEARKRRRRKVERGA